MNATEYGERKHETCRHGTLTEAWLNGTEPRLLPLCSWAIANTAPPALLRAWGGLVEFDRDCAVCVSHQTVEAA